MEWKNIQKSKWDSGPAEYSWEVQRHRVDMTVDTGQQWLLHR